MSTAHESESLCSAAKHGTPNGVRSSAFPWSINMAPLTGWNGWLCCPTPQFIWLRLCCAVFSVISVVKWFSALLSPRRHGEH